MLQWKQCLNKHLIQSFCAQVCYKVFTYQWEKQCEVNINKVKLIKFKYFYKILIIYYYIFSYFLGIKFFLLL